MLFLALSLVSGFLVTRLLYGLLSDPLRNVPGPFAARFTRFWELIQVRRGRFEQINYELHLKYGPVVRLAPGRYSIDEPSALKDIYGHASKFTKAPFYHAFGNPNPLEADLFSELDINRHGAKRRKVAGLYSMTSLLSYEPFVDHCNTILCSRLRDFASEGTLFEVPRWMQYYAFDVIGEITVGATFGMMESKDPDPLGVLDAIHDGSVYGSRLGLFSELHPWLGRMTQSLGIRIPFDVVLAFINDQIAARNNGKTPSDRADFLTKLLQMQADGKLESLDLINTMGANIAAGSDTTAIGLSTVVFNLIQHPKCAADLQAEIADFALRGKISDPVKYQEAAQMPYLQAVIKEALRIHPATGQPMSRIVPPGGAELAGKYFPEGTSVGANAWVVHHNQAIFGPDADTFRPERWLESQDKARLMDQNFFAFGAGARTCIGKNISLLEMSKLIPQLYRQFDFLPMEGSDKVVRTTDNVWFVKQSFQCRVKVRRA